jgi:hypothetical protein
MQKYAGQCLLGHSLTQRFMILDGVGNSSKSSFVLIVSGIIGRENVYELRPQFLEERFEIGRMVGRTLLVGSDVPRVNFSIFRVPAALNQSSAATRWKRRKKAVTGASPSTAISIC